MYNPDRDLTLEIGIIFLDIASHNLKSIVEPATDWAFSLNVKCNDG